MMHCNLGECSYLVRGEHLNGSGRLFGGQLMMWIDEVAGIAARRYCGRNIITASVEGLSFLKPAYVGDTIVIVAKVIYVGHTSMEVRVCTYVEKLDGEREQINEAYLIEVALDENDKPTPVEALPPISAEEKQEWEEGRVREMIRKQKYAQIEKEAEHIKEVIKNSMSNISNATNNISKDITNSIQNGILKNKKDETN